MSQEKLEWGRGAATAYKRKRDGKARQWLKALRKKYPLVKREKTLRCPKDGSKRVYHLLSLGLGVGGRSHFLCRVCGTRFIVMDSGETPYYQWKPNIEKGGTSGSKCET